MGTKKKEETIDDMPAFMEYCELYGPCAASRKYGIDVWDVSRIYRNWAGTTCKKALESGRIPSSEIRDMLQRMKNQAKRKKLAKLEANEMRNTLYR